MIIGLNHFLVLATALFCLGVIGVLVRKNAIIIFMSIELMLNAVNLALVAISHYNEVIEGQVLVFFVMTVAAAEVAVGLAIIVTIFRNRQSVNIDEVSILKW
jgi:NADH-quinone oxidoreductase subunit K